jgi:hypothetical protein
MRAFAALDPTSMDATNYQKAVLGMTASLIASHGAQVAARVVDSLPLDMRAKTVESSSWAFNRRPPEEMVPWLSTYSSQSVGIRDSVRGQLKQWSRADPDGALAWAGDFSLREPDQALGIDFFQRVGRNIDSQILEAWMNRNPNHPAAGAASEILHPSPSH